MNLIHRFLRWVKRQWIFVMVETERGTPEPVNYVNSARNGENIAGLNGNATTRCLPAKEGERGYWDVSLEDEWDWSR